jgi:hypothetical protein
MTTNTKIAILIFFIASMIFYIINAVGETFVECGTVKSKVIENRIRKSGGDIEHIVNVEFPENGFKSLYVEREVYYSKEIGSTFCVDFPTKNAEKYFEYINWAWKMLIVFLVCCIVAIVYYGFEATEDKEQNS